GEVFLFAFPARDGIAPAVLHAAYLGRLREAKNIGTSGKQIDDEIARVEETPDSRWAIVLTRVFPTESLSSMSSDVPAVDIRQDAFEVILAGKSTSLKLPDSKTLAELRGKSLPDVIYHRQRSMPARQRDAIEPSDALILKDVPSIVKEKFRNRLRKLDQAELNYPRSQLWKHLGNFAEAEFKHGSPTPEAWSQLATDLDIEVKVAISEVVFLRQIGAGEKWLSPSPLPCRLAVLPERGGAWLFMYPAYEQSASERIAQQHLVQLSPREMDSEQVANERERLRLRIKGQGPDHWTLLLTRLLPDRELSVPQGIVPVPSFEGAALKFRIGDRDVAVNLPPNTGEPLVTVEPPPRSDQLLVIVDWSRQVANRQEELFGSLQGLVRKNSGRFRDGKVFLLTPAGSHAWNETEILEGKPREKTPEPHNGQTLGVLEKALKWVASQVEKPRMLFVVWNPQYTLPDDFEKHWVASPEAATQAQQARLRIVQIDGVQLTIFGELVGKANYFTLTDWPEQWPTE
ncbi:MAG: hypothetical protein HYV60_12370, partial [Planctomycetia bacterium]|nr:hypothetical protein [Planctomycetia bacterium]